MCASRRERSRSTCASTSRRVRWSPCSGPTAPARRHCCELLPGWCSGSRGGWGSTLSCARALAPDRHVLLLDEPLAALDATTRAAMRRDLKAHLSGFRGVRLLVTHDPLEAAVLADRLIVMERGKHVQTGTPAEVTSRPRSPYVADLVGVNLFRGVAEHGSVRVAAGAAVAAAGGESG